MQAQLFQLSIVSRYVLSKSRQILFVKTSLTNISISECECNSDGSTSLDCDEDYGVCSCKEGFVGIKCHECMPNVIGDKCDTCQPGFLGYPSCRQG